MQLDNSTEERILEVATETFYKKGLSGARMQQIADLSGINKAMLHYYYKSKEHLFEIVFQRTCDLYLDSIHQFLNNSLPVKEKLAHFIDEVMDILEKHPFIPVFIIHELNQNPDRVAMLFSNKITAQFQLFKTQVEKEIKNRSLKRISAEQLFTDLISLTVMPFISQPILCKLMKKNSRDFKVFLTERKKELRNKWIAQL